MATDPAVQAVMPIIADLLGDDCTDISLPSYSEAVVAAVTPLIRAQAFTEAADMLEAEAEKPGMRYARWSLETSAELVRGLSEGTDA